MSASGPEDCGRTPSECAWSSYLRVNPVTHTTDKAAQNSKSYARFDTGQGCEAGRTDRQGDRSVYCRPTSLACPCGIDHGHINVGEYPW